MGKALGRGGRAAGHEAVIVSGPVEVRYPSAARVVPVVSTEEMLAACLDVFPQCAGLIAAAAPCDYRPRVVAAEKIRKSGAPIEVHLVETPDIVARLAAARTTQWLVAFALETSDHRMRAMQKLEQHQHDRCAWPGDDARGHGPGRGDRRGKGRAGSRAGKQAASGNGGIPCD